MTRAKGSLCSRRHLTFLQQAIAEHITADREATFDGAERYIPVDRYLLQRLSVDIMGLQDIPVDGWQGFHGGADLGNHGRCRVNAVIVRLVCREAGIEGDVVIPELGE